MSIAPSLLQILGFSITIGSSLFLPKVLKKGTKEILNDVYESNNMYIKKNGKKITPTLLNEKEYKYLDKLIIILPNGMSYQDFIKKQNVLESALRNKIKIEHEENKVYLTIYKRKLSNKILYNKGIIEELNNYKLALPIGYNYENKLICHDLTKTGKNILVAGTIRYGKSNLLNLIINAVILTYPSDKVKFYLLDLKNGVEFMPYEGLNHVEDVLIKSSECESLFSKLLAIHQKRMELVKKNKKKNINDLNIPHIIVIIDEFAALHDISLSDFTTLVQQSGASGFHFIISTQYPRADIVDTLIRTNCDVRIALHVKEPTASEVILGKGNKKAYNIPPIPGRAIYQYGDDIELQIPYLKENVIPDHMYENKKIRKTTNKNITDKNKFGRVFKKC